MIGDDLKGPDRQRGNSHQKFLASKIRHSVAPGLDLSGPDLGRNEFTQKTGTDGGRLAGDSTRGSRVREEANWRHRLRSHLFHSRSLPALGTDRTSLWDLLDEMLVTGGESIMAKSDSIILLWYLSSSFSSHFSLVLRRRSRLLVFLSGPGRASLSSSRLICRALRITHLDTLPDDSF